MARIQILELPTIYREHGDDETPFVLVIDEIDMEINADFWQDLPASNAVELLGARAILVFEETIEIPANNVPVDPDGHPVRFRVEGDFEGFRQQVKEQVLQGQGELARALRKP